MSYNAWSYVYSNPVNSIDPSGYRPPCPITMENQNWDCDAVNSVYFLRQAFIDSASRHNRIPTMDNGGFAALVASVVVSERRIGNYPPGGDRSSKGMQLLEDLSAEWGCIVSGDFLLDALKKGDVARFILYFTNRKIPSGPAVRSLASVGIGNVKLSTAINLWKGYACGNERAPCTPVQVSRLKTTEHLGPFSWDKDVLNPFDYVRVPRLSPPSEPAGILAPWDPDELDAYVALSRELLEDRNSIEYVAANLEAGALRAMSKRIAPSAFNSATWHLAGVQSDFEIAQSGWNPGGAVTILQNIPIAIRALEVSSTWSLSNEPR